METHKFMQAVLAEYISARHQYSAFNSTHEGIAVIQEEVDELWDLVKTNKGIKIPDEDTLMIKECIQIAAMAMAFVIDLSNNTKYI